MRIAALTMVYNESFNLPLWLRHYGSSMGEENLIIFDHGSTDGSTENIGKASKILLPRDNWDNKKRSALINNFIKGLFGFYDAILFSDADELLVPDLTRYSSLRDWIERNKGLHTSAIGLNIFHDYQTEPDLDRAKPVLRQRQYAYFRSSLSKPLIAFEPVEWGLGFHHMNKDHDFSDDLYLLHLRFVDRSLALERLALTRSMEWSSDEFKLNPNHYQRIQDDEFMKTFADGRVNYVRHKVADFDFSSYNQKLRESKKTGGQFTYFDLGISGLPVRMPEWMRDVI